MKSQSFSTSIEVNGSSIDVFNCINDIPKWWTKDFEGSSTNLNDEFVICHPGQHYSKQQVIEFISGKKVAWLVTGSKLNWLQQDQAEWTGTKMIFDITSAANKTVVHFTHEGLIPEKNVITGVLRVGVWLLRIGCSILLLMAGRYSDLYQGKTP